MSPKSRRWYQRGEQFYAVYYTTEFKYIGRGDAFIAPRDGTYTFKLWGSPGGNTKDKLNIATGKGVGGRGAYTEVSMYLRKNQKIYAYVGSAGAAANGDACAGGFNGGGPALVCIKGPHSGSGGGATHISKAVSPIISDVFVKFADADSFNTGNTYDISHTITLNKAARDNKEVDTGTVDKNGNPVMRKRTADELLQYIRDKLKNNDSFFGPYINNSTEVKKINSNWYIVKCHTWNNKNDVIAVAGGGGGASLGAGNGWLNIENTDPKKTNQGLFGYAGVDLAHGGKPDPRHSDAVKNAIVGANNTTHIGYTQGAGQYCLNSGGGGAGWYSGYSLVQYKAGLTQTNGGDCGSIGGGGTCYLASGVTGMSINGNDARLTTNTSYIKPSTEGINGYIKVIKQ